MGYIYLAIPYTGREKSSFKYSKEAVAIYMRAGEAVFSPIVHGHAVAVDHDLPRDWEFWKNSGEAMLFPAKALHILVPPGWGSFVRMSTGVKAETILAAKNGKEIHVVRLNGNDTAIHPEESEILTEIMTT